jgi:hypothetical protein
MCGRDSSKGMAERSDSRNIHAPRKRQWGAVEAAQVVEHCQNIGGVPFQLI